MERALVVANKVETSGLVRNNQVIGYRLTIIFQNTGRTLAKRVLTNASIAIFPAVEAVPSDFRYPDRIPPTQNYGVLGPNVLLPIPIDVAIQDIVGIFEKNKIGIVYGWLEYDDIFSRTIRRRTEFCAKIEVVGNPYQVSGTVGGPSVLGFSVYGCYNGIDEDCFYHPGTVPVAEVGELPEVTQPPPELMNPL